jgi:hypothetical protein
MRVLAALAALPRRWICHLSRLVVFTQQKDSAQIGRLCYNAVTMQYLICFANNNNNDNDDPRIVGRSFAG